MAQRTVQRTLLAGSVYGGGRYNIQRVVRRGNTDDHTTVISTAALEDYLLANLK